MTCSDQLPQTVAYESVGTLRQQLAPSQVVVDSQLPDAAADSAPALTSQQPVSQHSPDAQHAASQAQGPPTSQAHPASAQIQSAH